MRNALILAHAHAYALLFYVLASPVLFQTRRLKDKDYQKIFGKLFLPVPILGLFLRIQIGTKASK
jgi:hypothetical protein